MPTGDKTGPAGNGARTGRGAGYCAGYEIPGYMHRGPRMGFARGMGRRRGFRRRASFYRPFPMWPYAGFPGAYAPPAPRSEEEQASALKAEENWLLERLEAVREQMKDAEEKEEA